jgi:hypothetical protein
MWFNGLKYTKTNNIFGVEFHIVTKTFWEKQ